MCVFFRFWNDIFGGNDIDLKLIVHRKPREMCAMQFHWKKN